jgi:hypothetical protein
MTNQGSSSPLKNKEKLFGFQGRSLNPKSKLKYITIILDDSHPKYLWFG